MRWLSRPRDLRWLDVGSGTSALAQTILELCEPAAVVSAEVSEGIVQYAKEKTADARATFLVADAQDLRVENGAYQVVVSGLVLNFVAKPERMVTEMRRACRLNGRVALYVWDYAGEMQMMRHFWDAAVELDPAARALDEGTRFPLANTPAPHYAMSLSQKKRAALRKLLRARLPHENDGSIKLRARALAVRGTR